MFGYNCFTLIRDEIPPPILTISKKEWVKNLEKVANTISRMPHEDYKSEKILSGNIEKALRKIVPGEGYPFSKWRKEKSLELAFIIHTLVSECQTYQDSDSATIEDVVELLVYKMIISNGNKKLTDKYSFFMGMKINFI